MSSIFNEFSEKSKKHPLRAKALWNVWRNLPSCLALV